MGSLFVALLMLLPLAQNASSTPKGNSDAGKTFWSSPRVGCRNCHGVTGEGGYGPDLAGRGLSAEQFQHAVREPWGVMPAFTDRQVSDQSIADLAAYFASLPKVAQIGQWSTLLPANAPRGQRIAIAGFGCAQCHGPQLAGPRQFAGAVGGDLPWFEKMVYTHTSEFPAGIMGNFNQSRLGEAVLREIWTFMTDVGLRARLAAQLVETSMAKYQRNAGSVLEGTAGYTVTIENTGLEGKGVAAEDVVVSLLLPHGAKVVNTTGAGYEGLRRNPEGTDTAVWRVPKIAPKDKLTFTIALSSSEDLSGLQGSARWTKPTPGGDSVAF